MIHRFRRVAAPAVLLVLAMGCGEGRPGSGLTNGPPPAAGEKAAMRTDLPDAALPDQGTAVGRLGDNENDAGTAGRGGGETDQPKLDQADDSVRATPPTIESGSRSSAAGGTRPAETIQQGTPRSPH